MNKERAKELMDFDDLHVAVLGDIMLDEYMFGAIERISPEAPVPVVLMQEREVKLGGAANVAANTSQLGASTTLIGIIGEDEKGKQVESLCKTIKNLNAQLIKDKKGRTTSKTRVLAKNQQILRIDNELIIQANEEIVEKTISILDSSHHAKAINVLIFQDYNKGFFSPTMIKALMKWAGLNKVMTCLDPKIQNIDLFKGVTLFKPNLKEVQTYLNQEIDLKDEGLRFIGNQIFDRINCEFLVLTLSSKGIYIANREAGHHESIVSKSIIDVSGAGDTVMSIVSMLIYQLKATKQEIAHLANLAGAVVCSIPGVGVVKKQAIIDMIRE